MAGPKLFRDSLEDDHTVLTTESFNPYTLIPTTNNYNVAQPSSTPSLPNPASQTGPHNAGITAPPAHLELRQNNPQDCSNLCAALVDRATVEKQRTIIALNATFNQQIAAAKISAANGIREAQVAANSTVDAVILRANIVTSAASADVLFANRAVASANVALTSAEANATLANAALQNANEALRNISSASINEVNRLSSTISALQANVASAQAAAAVASQQAADAAAAAAAKPGSCLIPPPANTSPDVSITSGQVILIVIGVLILVFLLGFAGYFLLMRKKKMGDQDSYLDEKSSASSPRRLNSRMSSAFRTGNGLNLKYNPRKTEAQNPISTITGEPGGLFATSSGPDNSNSSNNINPNVSGGSSMPMGLSMVPVGSPLWPLTSHSTSVDSPERNGFETSSLKNRQNDQNQTSPRVVNVNAQKSPLLKEIAPVVSYSVSPGKYDTVIKSYPIFSEGLRVPSETAAAPRKPTFGRAERKRSQINITNPFDLQPTSPQKGTTPGNKELPLATKDTSQDIKTTVLDVNKSMMAEPSKGPGFFFSNYDNPFRDPVGTTTKSNIAKQDLPAPTPKTPRREVFDLEKLLSPKRTRVPAPETLAMLRREDAPRNSTVPEIDRLLQIVAKQSEKYNDKPLFWTDFRPADVEVEKVLSEPSSRVTSLEPEIKKEPVVEKSAEVTPSPPTTSSSARSRPKSPPPPVVENKTPKLPFNIPVPPIPVKKPDPRERTLSPLRRNPHSNSESPVDPSRKTSRDKESSPAQSDPVPQSPGQRELSPLRRNPSQVRNITSLLADPPVHINLSSSPPTAPPTAPPPAPPSSSGSGSGKELRAERGRSMIRTSDIIEARLSWKSQLKKQEEEALKALQFDKEKRDRTKSPLRRNPIDLQALRRSPSSKSHKSHENRDRTESPLRRNPIDLGALRRSPSSRSYRSKEKRDRTESPLHRNPIDLESLRRSPSLRSFKSGMSGTTANSPPPPPLPNPKRRSVTLSPPPSRKADSIPPLPVLKPTIITPSPQPEAVNPPKVRTSIQRSRSSNPHFSQVLERFQVIAAQNPVDKGAVSNEVTQRAIAGIYIPGSLREQAVRNSSTSRGPQGGGRSTSRGPQVAGKDGNGRSASVRR